MTESALEKLGRRSYDSYLARLHAQRRLHALGAWWDAAGYSSGTSLLAVSIVLLGMQGGDSNLLLPGGEIILAVASLVALIVSIVSSRLEYEARSKLMFINYRDLQRFSVVVESYIDSGTRVSNRRLRKLQDEYQNLLDSAENHTGVDHAMAKANGRWTKVSPGLLVQGVRSYVIPGLIVIASLLAVGWVATAIPSFFVQ